MAPEQTEGEPNPLDQLIELLVYAPVGLLYEYEEVLPKLIKRGRSQVQLARVLGQMALRDRQTSGGVAGGPGAEVVTAVVTRAINDVGAALGLLPPPSPGRPAVSAGHGGDAGDATAGSSGSSGSAALGGERQSESGPVSEPGSGSGLPIGGYDELTAREIIAMLDSLTAAERDVVRAHERSGRSRKTVLAKLDRLDR